MELVVATESQKNIDTDEAFRALDLHIMKVRSELNRVFPERLNKYECVFYVSGLDTSYEWAFIYEGIILQVNYGEHNNIISYQKNKEIESQTLVDTLGYLLNRPLYIYRNNEKLNEYISTLYDHIATNIFSFEFRSVKFKSKYNHIRVPKINHPILLSLYHTAIKQPEPFGKCIFLFRLIEYAYRQTTFDTAKPTGRGYMPLYVEYLLNASLVHNFLPCHKLTAYTKGKGRNYYSNLKVRCKKIRDDILRKGSQVGAEVYIYGRCALAHGNDPTNLVLHDYESNFAKITEINLLLELIASYLIERENQDLRNLLWYKDKESVHDFY